MSATSGFCTKRWPFQDMLEENWQVIRAEYESLGEDYFRAVAGLSGIEGWGAFSLFLLGKQIPENCARAPRTTEIVTRIPYMTSAGFAVLQPGVLYRKHVDRYPASFHRLLHERWNASIEENRRLHLPLVAENAYLLVENEMVRLEEGKSVVFRNTLMHAARNEGRSNRAILLIDFLDRPPRETD